MSRHLVKDICTKLRPLVKMKRDLTLESLSNTSPEKHYDVMIEVMNCAQWIRVDLELLIRAGFWLGLTEDELYARINVDQKDLIANVKKRLDRNDAEIDDLLNRSEDIQKALPSVSRKIENNSQILQHDIWHQNELKKLYGHFHNLLSKLAHPDMFFVFSTQVLSNEIRDFVTSDYSLCAKELDKEWLALGAESERDEYCQLLL